MTPSVIVVGAGPAGATAARTLALAGVSVLLLDRSPFPRNKPCGGAISVRALRRFPCLEAALSRIATHRLSRLYLEGPDGESTIIESDGPAVVMIRRVEFDALLVSLAVEAGATLVTGAEIVQASMDDHGVQLVARDGRRFAAPLVIAADGVVAQRLGIRPGWPASAVALDMMEEAPRETLRHVDPSTLWVAYGVAPGGKGNGLRERGSTDSRQAHEGYAYVFPKRDHVNVGIGFVLQHYRDAIAEAPYSLQRRFVEHLRARGIVEGESSRRYFTPFIIPVGGPLRKPGRGRVLLAGDAGGFVNGFTAEGIYYAMASGDLAATAVLATTPRTLRTLTSRYAKACNAEMGQELRESVLIQRALFADRRRIARVITGAAGEPVLTRMILDCAMGRVGYSELRRTLARRAPLFASRLLWERLRGLLRPPPFVAGTSRVSGSAGK
jgi:flavin-dependent dehydrogenase